MTSLPPPPPLCVRLLAGAHPPARQVAMTPEEKHHLTDGLHRAYDDAQEAQARDIIMLGIRKLNQKGAGGRRGSGAATAKSLGRSAAAAKGALGKIKFPGLKR